MKFGRVNSATTNFLINYRGKLKENQNLIVASYSNELHNDVLRKNGTSFWK